MNVTLLGLLWAVATTETQDEGCDNCVQKNKMPGIKLKELTPPKQVRAISLHANKYKI